MANCSAYVRAWEARNPERAREYRRASRARNRAKLGTRYVKDLMRKGCGLKSRSIPQSLVEAKKQHVALQREIGLWQRS